LASLIIVSSGWRLPPLVGVRELLVEPGQLLLVQRPLPPAVRVDGVHHDAADRPVGAGVTGVEGLARQAVRLGEAVPDRPRRLRTALEVGSDEVTAFEQPPPGVTGDVDRRSVRERGDRPRLGHVEREQQRQDLDAGRQRGQHPGTDRDRGQLRAAGYGPLQQQVVVAVHRQPGQCEADRVERSPGGVEQPRDERVPVPAALDAVDLAPRVPVADVA
jgi:hypothetical protein